ncbi:right-handed parallel beta-helix repeat-containing protein [Streptacidiphilus melanogenes]|uniref:right-handed parallel beta-helix repeat-containing protein n=1 Tax=Streptacidiphilus melanogenes TaxID=411235 RepID=UPI0005A61F08|nr:right-handed parallel beta-helix repeat-containing protein [Streptacidiphilus melanogenes]
MRSKRVARSLAPVLLAGAAIPLAAPAPASAADTGILYVNSAAPCSDTDPAAGSQAVPYCSLQTAVDAAQPGQTVQIAPGSTFSGQLHITHSGSAGSPITIQGLSGWQTGGTRPTVTDHNAEPAVLLDHVQNVVLRGLGVFAGHQGIEIDGGSQITLDSLFVYGAVLQASPGVSTDNGVTVQDGASGVTVQRSEILSFTGAGVAVQSADGTVLSTDYVTGNRNGGIVATDSPDTVVTSDTVDRNCLSGVSLLGAGSGSTGSTLENNVVADDDANGVAFRGRPACTDTTQPEVSVAAGSTSGTVLDYNVVAAPGSAEPYSWAGTGYASAAALGAATTPSQGVHDLTGNLSTLISTSPKPPSPVIDSADAGAPDELSTDLTGHSRVDDPTVGDTGTGVGYYDRGAFEGVDPFSITGITPPGNATHPAPNTVTFSATVSNPWNDQGIQYTFDFGDQTPPVTSSSPTASHTYTSAGDYTVVVTTQLSDGRKVTSTTSYYLPVDAPVTPQLTAAQDGYTPLTGDFGYSATTPWQLTGGSIDFGDGHTQSLNLTSTTATLTHAYAKRGVYTVTLTATDSAGHTARTSQRLSVGDTFRAVPPARILATWNGLGAPKAPMPSRHALRLKVDGVGGIPSSGVTEVVMNLTATSATSGGSLTAYQDGTALPGTTSLTVTPGRTTQSLVTVPVSPSGYVDLYTSAVGAQLSADVQGFFTSTSNGQPFQSQSEHVLDTSTGLNTTKSPLAAGHSVTLNAWRQMAMPVGLAGIVLDVTASGASAAGSVTVHAGSTSTPYEATLHVVPGQTVSNLVVVPIDNEGDILVTNSGGGSLQVSADVEGYYGEAPAPTTLFPLTPSRMLDTRYAIGAPKGQLGAGRVLRLRAAGLAGIPAGAKTVLLNLTALNASVATSVTAYADGATRPAGAALQAGPGLPSTVLVEAPIGSDGYVDLYNRAGSVDLLADVVGYYS